MFGGITANGGTTAGTPSGAYAQLTGFTGNSQNSGAARGDQSVIPDYANNRILAEPGDYRVEVSLSFQASALANAAYIVSVAKNGVAQPDLSFEFSEANEAPSGPATAKIGGSLFGVLKVAPEDCKAVPYVGPAPPANVPASPPPTQQPPVAQITLQIRNLSGTAQSMTLEYGQFNLYRLPAAG